MDSRGYLESYGWKEGEALKRGGLKKPILVKHKKDTKGLGHDSQDGDMWWEKAFDGQLKNLEVMSKGGVRFEQNQEKLVDKETAELKSPLYKMFVKGEGLAGTVREIKSDVSGGIDKLETKMVPSKDVSSNSNGSSSCSKIKRKRERGAADKKVKKEKKKRRKHKKSIE